MQPHFERLDTLPKRLKRRLSDGGDSGSDDADYGSHAMGGLADGFDVDTPPCGPQPSFLEQTCVLSCLRIFARALPASFEHEKCSSDPGCASLSVQSDQRAHHLASVIHK